jgi:hypothetical protein
MARAVLALATIWAAEAAPAQANVLACDSVGYFPKQTVWLKKPSRETVILTWLRHAGRRLGAIALLALLVRAIVPAGYMLAEADTPNGRYLVVQMCDAHSGPAQIIDLDPGMAVDASKQPGKTGGKTGDAPCVFAMATSVSLPASTAEPAVFRHRVASESYRAADMRPVRGIAAPPPPSTGPPSLI